MQLYFIQKISHKNVLFWALMLRKRETFWDYFTLGKSFRHGKCFVGQNYLSGKFSVVKFRHFSAY